MKKRYNRYVFPLPTEATYSHFKVGSWYRGINLDRGVVARFSGDPEKNSGWWSGVFVKDFFRLITPDNYEEIIDKKIITNLENKLKSCEDN